MCAVELNSFEQLKQCVEANLSHPLLEVSGGRCCKEYKHIYMHSFRESRRKCLLLSQVTLQVECLCVGPNVDQLDDNSLEQIGARKLRLNIDESFTGHNDAKNMDYLVIDKVLSR